jgi:hypothetical protein
MNFLRVIGIVTRRLDQACVRYALIGGFAMALRGVQRATIDLDFILMFDDLGKADAIFKDAGYKRAFHSENVSHYTSEDLELGRIDILHAFRGPTLDMLKRADRIEIASGQTLPVVHVEDIIGLKVQAVVNDPKRATADWADIRMILETSSDNGNPIDWELLQDYLDLFKLGSKLEEMKYWYGAAE